MSEDLRAALAASERRTARAEEEARVARRERDEAVESAARLREALRTFAEDADEDEPTRRDDGDERIEHHESEEDVSEDVSVSDEVSSVRAKLAAALDAAQRARRDADAAARAAEVASLRAADLEKQNGDLRGRIESADAATALARKQVAETSASLRRGLETPKNESAATLAAAAEMEAAVARLASTLRARERELDMTRATVATLVRERAEREEARGGGTELGGTERRGDGKNASASRSARKSNPPRENRAAAALAEARTLASRNRADRPGSRARAFTSTKSHG